MNRLAHTHQFPPAMILAGGKSRRMGRNKALMPLAGKALLTHVIDRLTPQTHSIALNIAQQDHAWDQFNLPLYQDHIQGQLGPLAGILTGLLYAKAQGGDWVLIAPCDTPFLPHDLVARLYQARQHEPCDILLCASGGRTHPVVGLWNTKLCTPLEQALTKDNIRKIEAFTALHRTRYVDFEDIAIGDHVIDPFTNLNRPEDAEAHSDLLNFI